MHIITAEIPIAQAKFFLLMTALFYQHVLGCDVLFWGDRSFSLRPKEALEDGLACSLQPCLAGFPASAIAPGESQTRGFKHTHGIVQTIATMDSERLLRLIDGTDADIETKVNQWREAGLKAASTIVYQSAVESAEQLGVPVPPEPLSSTQQRQCKFDGGLLFYFVLEMVVLVGHGKGRVLGKDVFLVEWF